MGEAAANRERLSRARAVEGSRLHSTVEDVEKLRRALGREKERRRAARQEVELLREGIQTAISDLYALLPEDAERARERHLAEENAELRGQVASLRAAALPDQPSDGESDG